MKKFFLGICSLFFLLTSCLNNDDPKPNNPDKLTIFAYLVANNNLDDDLLANIGAM